MRRRRRRRTGEEERGEEDSAEVNHKTTHRGSAKICKFEGALPPAGPPRTPPREATGERQGRGFPSTTTTTTM